jgi:hypothetical protein
VPHPRPSDSPHKPVGKDGPSDAKPSCGKQAWSVAAQMLRRETMEPLPGREQSRKLKKTACLSGLPEFPVGAFLFRRSAGGKEGRAKMGRFGGTGRCARREHRHC